MRKNNYLCSILFFLFLFISAYNLFAIDKGKHNIKNKRPKLSKITGNSTQSVMDINNITSWVGDQGFHDRVVGGGSWNGAYPNGANVGVIFSEGIVWGGKVNDGSSPLVRVDGNTYLSGTKAIIRLFRVRPDYKTGDLTRDAADFFHKSIDSVTVTEIQTLKSQYQKDWDEWPARQGAPYEDVNNDGVYEPDIDIPGIPGADQTIFIKYDDANSDNLYGSPPIGLEVSETYWAYADSGALGNVIYKEVNIVYKGTSTSASNSRIDSMFIVQWADPDVGYPVDDLAGCDTTLNLGYAYNSKTVDRDYRGLGFFPAVGYAFLQGVSAFTGNPNDSALFNLKWRKGYRYVYPKPMSSFVYFGAGETWVGPSFDYKGTLRFYNLMRSSLSDPPYPTFTPFPNSIADVTPYGTYLLDGDPVAGTGKIDGTIENAGGRRIMVTSGPITMNLGDTAQVVIALVGGMGTTNLDAVTQLKNNVKAAQIVTSGNYYNYNPIPSTFKLEQNYPNPFNSSTKIIYQLSASSKVVLKIYDVLGREVRTLVNKEQSAGRYLINFNASGLTSGVYFYRLRVGSFVQTKKMVLLK